MPCALEFAPRAIEAIGRLCDSLPTSRREPAVDAIDRLCKEFAANPDASPRGPGLALSFRLEFVIEGVTYNWAATYLRSTGEGTDTIHITHVFRIPL